MDETEFSARILRMKRRLYCVAYSILWNDADCADAMQETAARAWTQRFRLRNEDFFETWLIRILINECRALIRKQRKTEVGLSDDLPGEEQDANINIDLQNALKQLKSNYRLPLILHYQDGYSLREVGHILGIRESLVKSRLHQARKELKHLLGGDENEA